MKNHSNTCLFIFAILTSPFSNRLFFKHICINVFPVLRIEINPTPVMLKLISLLLITIVIAH